MGMIRLLLVLLLFVGPVFGATVETRKMYDPATDTIETDAPDDTVILGYQGGLWKHYSLEYVRSGLLTQTIANTLYDSAGAAAGVQTNLTTHANNAANPHGVTAAQVGSDPAGTDNSGLTDDQKAAISAANTPSAANPLATQNDLPSAASDISFDNATAGLEGEPATTQSAADALKVLVDTKATTADLGAAASLDATNGTIGDAVVWVDDGDGNASLPIDVEGSNFTPGASGMSSTTINAAIVEAYNNGGGSLSITEQASDPVAGDLSDGDIVVSTASGDLFLGSATGMYTIAGTYTVNPVTYSLTIDLVDGNATDKITYLSTDYTTDQTITGLSAESTFTITPDTDRTYSFSGTGCTDSSGTVTCSTDSQDSSAQITFSDVVAACSSTPTYSAETLGDTTGSWMGYRWVGSVNLNTTDYAICALDFNVGTITGDISSKDYFVSIYTVDGSKNLGTQLGTVSVSGGSITTGWNSVTFNSTIQTGTAGWAVVIGETTPDYANYFDIYYGSASGDANITTVRWDSTGDYNTELSYDTALRIYGAE